MKVVFCKKCNAKYQLDDEDDISDYECTICDGGLELDEEYNISDSNAKSNSSANIFSKSKDKYDIVYCKDCGLKYRIGKSENVSNYECDICDGELSYVDENLNLLVNINGNSEIIVNENYDNNQDTYNPEDIYGYENDRFENSIEFVRSPDKSKEKEEIRKAILSGSFDDGFISPAHNENSANLEHDNVSNIINNDISGSNSNSNNNNNSNSNITKKGLDNEDEFEDFEQAKYTKIKNLAISNFSINLDKTYNDSNISSYLSNTSSTPKNSPKSSSPVPISTKNMENDGTTINTNGKINSGGSSSSSSSNDNASSSDSHSSSSFYFKQNKGKGSKKDVVSNPNVNRSFHDYFIIAGLVVALLGFSDFILTSRPYGVIFIGIGIVIFAYGVYINKKNQFTEKRSRIIREALLTLPPNFYVLYYLKIPNINAPINHVVIGPTGIFTILTQKYTSKEKSELKQDEETLELIKNLESNETINSKEELNALIDAKTHEKSLDDSNINLSKNTKSMGSGDSVNNKDNEVIAGVNNGANQTKFKLGNAGEIKFDTNNKIKQKSILLSIRVAEFLEFNKMSDIYIEPFIGFANDNIAIINSPLNDEDLFINELLDRISQGPVKINSDDVNRCAVILSNYAVKCSS
ncbi:MAG: hypothetical protein ACRCVG_02550 [Methanobacteriaceae archaeon]